MLSGVSPCAICHAITPLLRSIAVMRPYGGLTSGRPCTVSDAPLASAAAGPAGDSAPASAPAPPLRRAPAVAVPWTNSISEKPESGDGTNPSAPMLVCEYVYTMWVSGSYDPPGQLVPPVAEGRINVASGPSGLLTTWGVNIGPILYRDTSLT